MIIAGNSACERASLMGKDVHIQRLRMLVAVLCDQETCRGAHHQEIGLDIKECHCCITSHAILRLLPLQQLQSAIDSKEQSIVWDCLCGWQRKPLHRTLMLLTIPNIATSVRLSACQDDSNTSHSGKH